MKRNYESADERLFTRSQRILSRVPGVTIPKCTGAYDKENKHERWENDKTDVQSNVGSAELSTFSPSEAALLGISEDVLNKQPSTPSKNALCEAWLLQQNLSDYVPAKISPKHPPVKRLVDYSPCTTETSNTTKTTGQLSVRQGVMTVMADEYKNLPVRKRRLLDNLATVSNNSEGESASQQGSEEGNEKGEKSIKPQPVKVVNSAPCVTPPALPKVSRKENTVISPSSELTAPVTSKAQTKPRCMFNVGFGSTPSLKQTLNGTEKVVNPVREPKTPTTASARQQIISNVRSCFSKPNATTTSTEHKKTRDRAAKRRCADKLVQGDGDSEDELFVLEGCDEDSDPSFAPEKEKNGINSDTEDSHSSTDMSENETVVKSTCKKTASATPSVSRQVSDIVSRTPSQIPTLNRKEKEPKTPTTASVRQPNTSNVSSCSSQPNATAESTEMKKKRDQAAKKHCADKPVQSDNDSEEDLSEYEGCNEDYDPSFAPENEKNGNNITENEASQNSNSDASENESAGTDGENTPVKKTKKKIKEERQRNRNLGLEYKTWDGKTVRARKRKDVHKCVRICCDTIISPEIGDELFKEYWGMGSYERRVAYVCARLEVNPTERSRKRDLDSNRSKQVSYKYFFHIDGQRHQVCKETFLGTLDETDTFIRKCCAKLKETRSSIPPKERRGNVTPKHSHTDELKSKIKSHISSYPAYVSHYCRKQTKQKYLSSSLNVRTMVSQFNEENADSGINVSYSAYWRIFKSMKLKFKSPASDTCAKCDEFKSKIKFAKSEEEKSTLTEQHELHLRKAEAAYNLKRKFKQLAKEDKSVRCLIFDLEQVFPTPNVTCGKAYYLRQLSTYNLTIVDTTTNKTFNYMWHEGEAPRGACEIASCLFKHIMDEIPEEVRHIYLFSDCCSGQNRNSIVAAMLLAVMETHATVKKIDHIFLVPGHTRMECDAKHSRIEHQKAKSGLISVPSQWYEVVRNFGPSYKVIEMANSFINFPELLQKNGPLIMRDRLEDNTKMYWTKSHWFQYNYNTAGIIKVRSSFAMDSEMSEYNMIRGNGKQRKLPPNWFCSLNPKPPGNKISQVKMNDLKTLLPYIPEVHHEFYNSLKVDSTIQLDTDPDLPSENEDTPD